jgi:hypothetical protein
MFGLGFLAPAFLAGLLAVAIPVLLHLFRRRTDRVVDFPAAQLLADAPVERHERRKLRDLLLLALRAAALVLLAVSFARPYFEAGGDAVAAPSTVVAIDRSLSLGAPGQWAEASRLALEAVRSAPATHTVGVVAFDDRAELVAAPGPDRALATAAIANLNPGAGGTRYTAALARAAEALGPGGGRIVVVTDAQSGGWQAADAAPTPDAVEIQVAMVPPPAGNLAVTGARLEGGVLTAVVQSYAPGPRTATVHARVAGRELARERVELSAVASAEVTLRAAWPATGALEVRVDDTEGYAADNARFLALDRGTPASVVVLTADPPESATTGLYVERALEAASPGTGAVVRVVDGRRVDLVKDRPDALVVLGTRTLTRATRSAVAAYLAGGGRVWLALGPDVDVPSLPEVVGVPLRLAPDPVRASGEEAALVPADRRHPMLRRLTGSASALSRLPIEQYRRVLDEQGWDVLARFAGGAVALAERRVGEGVLVLFTSDLDNRWNRFPLEPSFAPFVVETARYLTGSARSRSVFTLPDVPEGVPPAPGAHRVGSGAAERLVIVNVNAAESDPTAITADAFVARVPRSAELPSRRQREEARVQENAQRLWQIGLLVMLAVLAVEGVLGRGRRAARALAPKVG